MSLNSPAPTLTALTAHLTRLRTTLDPLLGQPFTSLLHALESGSSQPPLAPGGSKSDREAREEKRQLDGRLDSAKVQAATAYTLCAVVWVYLKTKGIDPRTHPIHGETERVLTYLRRIKALENPGAVSTSDAGRSIEGKRSAVDQDAASRFIRAALSGNEGRHTRFEGEEEGKGKDAAATSEKGDGKRKGKGKADEATKGKKFKDIGEESLTGAKEGKKKRKVMDPFEGYASTAPPQPKPKVAKAARDSSPSPPPPSSETGTGKSSSSPARKAKGKEGSGTGERKGGKRGKK